MKNNSSGQVLLIIVLSIAVLSSVVLSIASKSVSDVSVSTRDEESLRAFSAAEAGVEKALSQRINVQNTIKETINTDTQSQYSATAERFPVDRTRYNYPDELTNSNVGTVWFVEHDPNNNLTCTGYGQCFTGSRIRVCFGESGTAANSSTTPAIEVAVVYAQGAANQVVRMPFDPNSGRRASNGFTGANASNSCVIEGKRYMFDRIVNFTNIGVPAIATTTPGGLKMMRVRMIYNTDRAQPFGIEALDGSVLPSQGKTIISTGQSGQSTRKIEVKTLYPALPPLFDSAIYSPNDIVKD